MPAARDVGHAGPRRKVRAPQPRPRPAPAPSFPRSVPRRPGAVTRPTPAPAKVKGPPTPAPRKLERIRQQNVEARQLRNAKTVNRQYKREGARTKIKGPPTPPVAVQRKWAERGASKVAKGDQVLAALQRVEYGGKRPEKDDPRREPSIPELRQVAAVGSSKTARRKLYEADLKAQSTKQQIERAGVDAPVLKVLEQTMRPTHAIAGGTRAALRGENVPRAVSRGAQLKDKHTFSDVLKETGVKNKAARGVGGFALDVATDPLTYLTFGTASVARKAATKAAEDAAKAAAKAGMSEHGAKVVARQAAKRAEAKVKTGKGVTVKFAGRELPGVRRGTAAVARGVGRPVRKITPARVRRIGTGTHKVARHLRPMLRPAHIPEQQFAHARGAARTARVSVQNAEKRAYLLSRDLKKRLPAEDYEAVIDALERNKLGRLPKHIREDDELRGLVHDLRSTYRHAFRVGRRAGAIKGKVGGKDWLTSGDRRKLRKTLEAEPAAQARRVTQLERHETRAQQKAAIAETEAVGKAEREAAVTTERQRGQARLETERQRHRTDVEFERSHGGARVSVAQTKTSPALKAAQATQGKAEKELESARRALLRIPVTRRRSGTPAAVKAQKRVDAARQAVSVSRKTTRAEQRRIAGVAPTEHDRLLAALEGREAARTPVPVPAPVKPNLATTPKAGRAAERYESRAAQTFTAQRRHEAAQSIPKRGLVEGDAQYLRRLIKYADKHDLPLIKRRAEGLLKARPTDAARGYFPRDFDPRIAKQLGISEEKAARATAGVGRTISKITPGFRRAEQRRLSSVNPVRLEKGQEPFSTDIPLVTLNHLKSVARQAAKGEFHKGMADLGRKVKSADDLRPGEQLYKLGYRDGTFGLHEVQNVPKSPTKGGQYVALDKQLVEELAGTAERLAAKHPAGEYFDRATGTWKRFATASLAFHIRNLIGDVSQSYLEQSGLKLPRNTLQAGKAIRRASEQARTVRPTKSDATVKVAGKPMPVDDFLAGARKHGVLDAGFIGRELQDLSGKGAERVRKIGKGGGRFGQFVDRAMTNRENLMRLSTYKAQLDKGLTEEAAAEIANRIHIDYGELSGFEREVMRRVFPFYTWTARSLPVTAGALVKTPGKFANLEKAREETGKGFTGMSEDEMRSRMTQAIQRQVPFVVKVGNGPQALSYSAPATLLGELPTDFTKQGLSEYLEELGRFGHGMVNPIVKGPFEWRTGRNLVTKREIEPADRPLVSAPSFVKLLPGPVKKALDVKPDFIDPKTGKKTWGWRGRADYTYDQLMLGWLGQAAAVAGAGRVPASTKGAAVSSIVGVRADPLGGQATKYAARQRAQRELDRLDRRAGILNQQGITTENATPEYTRLRKRILELNKIVDATKPAKKKGASSSGGGGQALPGFSTGGSGGGGSSSGYAGF